MNKLLIICLVFVFTNCGETKDKTTQSTSPPIINNTSNSMAIEGRAKYVRDYGAVGNGITDDTRAIQKAMDDGDGTVILMGKHKISASLQNRNKNTITFQGQGKAKIVATSNSFYKFESINDITISAVEASPPFLKLIRENKTNKVEIRDCDIKADIANVKKTINYAIHASGKHNLKNIIIIDNNFANTTVFYAGKEVSANTLRMKGNTITNFKSFVAAIQHCDFSYVENNTIIGAMSGTKSVRVMLRTGLKETYFKNNTIKNIHTDVMTSVLYSSSGTLFCDNNTFKNIRGNGNSYIIADKASSNEKWFITNNTFDQLGVQDQKLNGIISGGNNEVLIENNTFKNITEKPIQLGNSNVEKINQELSIIKNNKFINIKIPICINLTFNTGPVSIIDNQVETFRNPILKKALHDTMCRFVNVTNTSKDFTIGEVLIQNNTLKKVDENSCLVWFNSKNGGGISKATVKNNTMDSGKYLIKYRNKETLPKIILDANNIPSNLELENRKNKNLKINRP